MKSEKIRVTYLITELVPCGAERIVYHLATGLCPTDFKVEVICIWDIRGAVGQWLEQAGIEVYYLDVHGKLDIFKFGKLVRHLRQRRPHILHCHLIHANILGRLAGRLARVPWVLSTIHIAEKRNRPWHFWADALTARWTACEICVSEAVARFTMHKAKISPHKLHVIYNGIPWQRFAQASYQPALKTRLGLGPQAKIIGAVGRLDHQKGYAYLIDAMPTVLASIPEACLIIVGEGPLRKALEKRIKERGLEQHVILTGFQDPALFYKIMDVFCLPSIYEGFGLVVVEAMAAGCPVVACAVDSIPEIVQPGVTGILVPPKNPQALAQGILEVLSNPQQARNMAHQAILGNQPRFALERMVQRYSDLYKQYMRISHASKRKS